MSYTCRTYDCAPRAEDLSPKQRRRIRDLLAFVFVTGRMPRGLVSKHAAGSTILFCTGWDDAHAGAEVDARSLAEYDVVNHPLCKLNALLISAGYTLDVPKRRAPQNRFSYYAPTGERDRISIYQISKGVNIDFEHSERVEQFVRAYCEQVGGTCYDLYLRSDGLLPKERRFGARVQ